MNIFVTGAAGYIGGSVAQRLLASGHHVRGLVRTPVKAVLLAQSGIEPVVGTLEDDELLMREGRAADAVIDAASADHAPSVRALIAALDGSGKPLLHTSGSSLIGDESRGSHSTDTIIDEDSALVVGPGKQRRYDIDRMVLQAADRGVRSAVICPSLIYGEGRGLNPRSVQIPLLTDNAREQGVVQVVGRGLNRWSNVHIDDLTELYRLVLTKGSAGALYFAENGEACFAELGAAIAARLKLNAMEFLPPETAAERWGESRAYYTLGSNSRVRANRARHELGWTPHHTSAVSWILSEMPL